MGGGQSTPHSVSVTNPNEIEVSKPVLCNTFQTEDLPPPKDQVKTSRVYTAEETEGLTAKLDEDYVKFIKDVEYEAADITIKRRDELVEKANALYERFAYVEAQPVCQAIQNMVLKCYETNRHTSINCSDLAKDFTDCVREKQLSYNVKEHMPKPRKRSLKDPEAQKVAAAAAAATDPPTAKDPPSNS